MTDLDQQSPPPPAQQIDPNVEVFRMMVVEGARIVSDGNVRQEKERTQQAREETERLRIATDRGEKQDRATHRKEMFGLGVVAAVIAVAMFSGRWDVVTHALAAAAGFVGGVGYHHASKG
ncbi:hypothetical protein C3942_16835 [Solimonas fluminis]|uniref:DUF2335 domain-containing protein n=1 Tax=Solimonas fluminis TaxID=2086571 RepID=A0A2S5TCI2_9GAMM|nr:hypothetical protein [Solimonas fluminis]PPE72714.1 hypothetical protein C3942_16835 [Solimonas fluminis]